MKVFIGWDERDALAYKVCEASLRRQASIPLDIIPIKIWDMRKRGFFHRGYHTDGDGQKTDYIDGKPFSTDFSFTRFLVPALCDYADEDVLFCDPDMLWRKDIALLPNLRPRHSVACVQHSHNPVEEVKALGVQTRYFRKNWSSLMLMNPSRCRRLTRHAVNNMNGGWLHGFGWAADHEIGSIDETWNWLVGHSCEDPDPAVVHFTSGTPDMLPTPAMPTPFEQEWWSYGRD